ncbi:MAG: putative oxidoreductase [Pyrinomonadaceae bacterium]|nr:putative oxidoreductase [Pyrinomonadaceae bacterium]
MFQSLIATTATWFTLPVRLALGLIFMAHGAQKAFGVWGGPGWSKFLSFPAPFGFMRPTWLWMGAALFAELIGGALVFFGLLTRVGAFFLAITMLVAMVGVHWSSGFFLSNKGIEYTVALLGMSLALLVSGGGRLSVDEKLQAPPRRRW